MAGRGRRGVSPIVATLLLIVIAVVGAVVTYAFVSGFVSMPAEAPSASISVDCVTGNETHVIIYVRNTGASQAKVDYVYVEQGGALVASEDVDVDVPPGSVAAVGIGNGGLGTATYTFKVACAGSALPAVFSGRIAGSTTTSTDTTPPACSLIGANTSEAGALCLFSSTWGDDAGLSGYVFSTNLTGAWVNSSWAAFSGSVGSEAMTLPPVGTVVGYTFYANDTSDNWGDSGVQYLTTGEYLWVPQNTTVVTGYTSPAAAPSGTWANPSYAYADGANYATTSTALAAQQWGAYGFTLPSNTTEISSVIIRYDASYTPFEITFTETIGSFTPSGTGWQAYNIASGNGVPANSVAEVILCVETETVTTLGVRTAGSSLDRYVTLNEAEAGGATAMSMYVKVNSSGFIETYCSSMAGVTFYVMGYWENVDYTELISYWDATTTGSWTNYNLASQSVPADRVAQIFVCHNTEAARARAGVRNVGFSSDRYIYIHEAEDNSASSSDYAGFSLMVQSNSSGYIQYYGSTMAVRFYVLGYFDDSLDYTSSWTRKNPGSTGWTNWDCTAQLDQDGRVVTFLISHAERNAERSIGGREGGTSPDRYILIKEAETNGYEGYCLTIKTNSTGYVDLYTSTTNEYFYLTGYFVPQASGSASVRIDASYDGGSSWVAFQETALTTSETTYTYDVGGLRTWSYSELDDADFRVRATAIISGLACVRLDWVPVNVTYTYNSSHWEYVLG